MNQNDATFWAAIIAAIVSVVNLFFASRAKRSAEMRVAYRKLLSPHICKLGEALHQILAATNVLLRRAKFGSGKGEWEKRGQEASDTIEVLRRKLRYPLWGIDSGLKRLRRVLNWSQHLKVVPDEADKLFIAGDKLKDAIDEALRYSFSHGRPPSWRCVLLVQYRSWKLAKTYEKAMKTPIDDEQVDE